MSQIYSGAGKVVVWLGEEMPESYKACETLQQFVEGLDHHDLGLRRPTSIFDASRLPSHIQRNLETRP